MKFIGGFFKFARRVLEAAKKGGLAAADLRKLDNLLARTGKRNTVLAKGILSALSAGGASDNDVTRFGEILKKGEERISNDKDPFTESDQKELNDIFNRAYISSRTARWFSQQMDELLAEEIKEFMEGSRRVDIGVPRKKSVTFEVKTPDKKPEKKKKAKI